MGTMKGIHCWWSQELFIFLFLVNSSYCVRNEQLEEPDFLRIPEHPIIDETSMIDPEPFKPHKVQKPQIPAVILDCKCGEHDYNDTNIEFKNCGQKPWRSPTTSQKQIQVNQLVSKGNLTDRSQFPWVVALVERRSNGSAIHFCGGTLISNKLVLTALHCFMRRYINRTEVWLNERNLLLSTEGDHTTLKIKARRLIIHPAYNPIMNYNDIALVELTETVDVHKSYVRPICLPYDESFDNKDYAYTAGWGQTSYGGPKSNELRHVCMPLLVRDKCIDHSVAYYRNRVTEYMICAGDVKKGGPDACPGDSGGPLFVESGKGEANRHYLVGVVSWGEQCGLPKRPGVYTRISKYLTWIHHQAKDIPDNKLCGYPEWILDNSKGAEWCLE